MFKYIQRAAERLMIPACLVSLPDAPEFWAHFEGGGSGACVYFAYLTLHLSAKLS